MTANGLTVDRAEIVRAVRVFHKPGAVVELRALDVVTPNFRRPHIASGYFNDWDKLAAAAVELSPSSAGCYIIANPINPDLLSRRANRVEHGPQKTTPADLVTSRRWLLFDLDPKRLVGISATDDEHEASHKRAQRIRTALKGEGWPEPVALDSGNGWWLCYRIDLPNDDVSGELIEHVLLALDLEHGGDVDVDQSLGDANQLVRLAGTLNRKGDSLPQRPHRLAQLANVPEPFDVVSRELLEHMAARVPREILVPPVSPRSNGATDSFDQTAFMAKHFPEAGAPRPWRVTGWLWKLPTCPWNAEHIDSAYAGEHPGGAYFAGCHHNTCQRFGWADLRERFEPGYRDGPSRARAPTGASAREAKIHSAALKEEAAAETISSLFETARQTAERVPLEPDWCVHGLAVMGGVTELDGEVKSSGKTTFALALAWCVVNGLPFLGRHTRQSPVVILTEQPTVSFAQALARAGLSDRDDVHILYHGRVRDKSWSEVGGLAIRHCKAVSARLLIVDTIGQFGGFSGDEENSTGKQLEAAAPLQVAADAGLAVWANRHDRKSGGEVGESGRGGSAFSGTVDIVLQLTRPEASSPPNHRVLKSLSRFEETPDNLTIALNKREIHSAAAPYLRAAESIYEYEVLGSVDDIALQRARRTLMDTLPTGGEHALDIDELLERTVLRRTTLQEALNYLLSTGAVARTGKGVKGDKRRYFRSTGAPEKDSAAADVGNGGMNSDPDASQPPKMAEDAEDGQLRYDDMIPDTADPPGTNGHVSTTCPTCGGSRWWLRDDGTRVCERCEPDPNGLPF